jgi:hypothetical protein
MLGVCFRSDGHRVWWRHCEANRNKWAGPQPAQSLRDLASLVGIALWDWAVSGAALGAMRPVTRLAEEIRILGAQETTAHVWDHPIPKALQEGAALAWTYVQEVAAQMEKERVLPRTSYTHRVFMATDE